MGSATRGLIPGKRGKYLVGICAIFNVISSKISSDVNSLQICYFIRQSYFYINFNVFILNNYCIVDVEYTMR
jgi:hypothetical protein